MLSTMNKFFSTRLIAIGATLASSSNLIAQSSAAPNHCSNSTVFVDNLNMDGDFNVSLVIPCSDRTGYVVIYDPLTDSFDAINIDSYDPQSQSGTATDYYYANSARSFFDLDREANGGGEGMTGFRDRHSGILFLPFSLDYFQSLAGAFSAFSQIQQMPSLTLNGAHHRTLIDSAIGKGVYTWATGDYAQFDELDSKQAQGEIGISHDFGIPNFRAGIGLGYSDIDQDLTLGGENKTEGQYLVLEADYQFTQIPITLSGLFYYGSWDAEIDRNYLSGGVVNRSSGNTDIDSYALRLRADWHAYQTDQWEIKPRVSFTWTQTDADGYSETGGAFPASYVGQEDLQREVRIGIDVDYKISEKLTLRTIGEYFYTWDDETSLRGNISGGTNFSFSAQDLSGGAFRGGMEIAYDITNSQRIYASLFASTSDISPDLSGAISYGIQF